MNHKTALAILFGGCSTEYEVSLQSADDRDPGQLAESLDGSVFSVFSVENGKDGIQADKLHSAPAHKVCSYRIRFCVSRS